MRVTTWFYIRSTAEEHTFWSNADGWGGVATATPFTGRESMTLNLPLDGEWVEWSEAGLKS